MFAQFRASLVLLILITVVTGLGYPLVVTAIAQLLFPYQANGSIIEVDDQLIGSELIGQNFTTPEYFWGRLSATAPHPYNAAASSGSNLGPMNPALTTSVSERVGALRAMDASVKKVPVDLVTSSASGLDPHISPAAAEYQIERVAKHRQVDAAVVRTIVERNTKPRQFGLLGEPHVNVLLINLELDRLSGKRTSATEVRE